MHSRNRITLLFALAAAGCAGSAPAPSAPTSSADGRGGRDSAKSGEQVAQGKALYAKRCAACHGTNGEGRGRMPALVGSGALPLDPPEGARRRTTQFKTVADLADFVVHAMPANAPGSLSADEYWAIVAFDLDANGIDTGGRALDAAVAATLSIPR